MAKIYYFNYAAIALIFTLFVSARFRNISIVKGNRAFLVAVAEIAVTTVFDIYAVYYDNLGAGNVMAKYISHGGYLYFHTLSSFFYLIYLISLTDTWHKLTQKKIKLVAILLPIVVFTAAFVLNFTTYPWMYYINEFDVYTRGTYMIANYVIAAIYLAYGVYYIIRYHKLFTKSWIFTLFVPYPFVGLAMAVEYFNPHIIIEMFFNVLAMLFLYMNIQRPGELVDSATGLGNTDALEANCRRIYFNNKPMYIIMVDIINYASLKDILDIEATYKFRMAISSYLTGVNKKMNLKADCYYGHRGRFFMFVEKRRHESIDDAAKLLLMQFNQSLTIDNTQVYPSSAVCIVKVPEDIPDPITFLHFCNNDLTMLDANKITYASELFKDDNHKIFLNIDSLINDGLENNRFEVYYQPIYSVEKKRFVSAEALLRLNNPDYGTILPAVFIPAAERSGAINPIWDYLLNSVCSFISSDKFAKLGLDYIELNLSAVQCTYEKLPEQVLDVVDKYNVDHGKIALEVIESAMLYNPVVLEENLRRLRYAGFVTCLDGYGDGYSSTRRVLDLPFDIIKLDSSFLDESERSKIQTILRGTVKLLKEVGAKIVAVGIEEKREVEMLENFGSDMIQGFYYSRPLPLEEFVKLFENEL